MVESDTVSARDRLTNPDTWEAVPSSWTNSVKKSLACCRIVEETHDVKSFFFAAVDGVPFSFEPGQFITLSLDIAGQSVARCYTISSPPTRPYTLSITVKRVAGGRVSNWLHENIRLGSIVEAFGPSGVFTPTAAPSTKSLYLSAGSGITPLMSMLRAGMDLGLDRDVVFVNSARTPTDIIFRRELSSLSAEASRLRVVHVCESTGDELQWDGFYGRLNLQLLKEQVPDFAQREVFVCGPAGYMLSIRDVLRIGGHDPSRYHQESFDFDAQDVEEIAVGSPGIAGVSVSEQAACTYTIRLARTGKTFTMDDKSTILAAVKREGVRAASVCGQGMCGTCKTTLLEGTVDMKHNGGIRQREIDMGKCLICCSRPTSDLVLDL